MKFDELLAKIGGFGRFQRIQFGLVVVPIMFIGMNQLDLFFLVSTPGHRCLLDNDTVNYLRQSPNYTTQAELESAALEPGSACSRLVLNLSEACLQPADGGAGLTYACQALGVEGCLDGRRFGDEFGATVVTEFDLVCEQSIVATVVKSLTFVGPFIGGIAFGQLSDRSA
uniref:Organic cation transporter protein-like n=1 Tax=Macrostomum lignano TaxID=282301 RepID=A0A1I8IMG6_9PLAT